MSGGAGWAAAGQAASGLIGTIGNVALSRRQNKRMVDFWKMQNAYNHPVEQMKRLEEAGLNPNLIYGDSVSGATGRADAIGTPDKPEFGNPLRGLTDFINARRSNAQTDLLQQQQSTELQRGILTAEKAGETQQSTIGKQQQNRIIQETWKSQLQAQKLMADRLEQDVIGKQLDNDFKDRALRDRVKKLYYDAQMSSKSVDGRALQNDLLRMQKEFLRLGLDRNSPWYAKIFGNIINKLNER